MEGSPLEGCGSEKWDSGGSWDGMVVEGGMGWW